MRRTWAVFAVLAFLALSFVLARDFVLAARQARAEAVAEAGKDKDKDKHILTTSGTGVVHFRPDSARVFLRVDSQAPTITETRGHNNKDVQKVLAGLKALKIPDLKMKSDNITVTEVFERATPVADRLPKVLGYRVSYYFTALVENEDPAKLGEYAAQVLDTALANGANNLQQVLIFRKDQTDFRRQALTRAVEDALANARALAAGASKTIQDTTVISGEPRYVYFDNNTRLQNTLQSAGGGGEGESTAVMAGELEVTCRVNITCRY
jgi:uncharacterized protein YggE